MKVGVIIQARTTSTRLPGKVLLPLPVNGKVTVLQHVIRRIKKAELVDSIIIATTINKSDDPIVEISNKEEVFHYRGSEHDVLSRFYGAAVKFRLDKIIRVTSDCPCIDPQIIDNLIALHLEKQADYTSNGITRTFPRGLGAEVINFEILKKANTEARELFEREHVTPYVYHSNPSSFKIVTQSAPEHLKAPDVRLTLDTPQDYLFFDRLYQKIGNKFFTTSDVLEILQKNKELLLLNKDVEQKKLDSEPSHYLNYKKVNWQEHKVFSRENIMLWPSLVLKDCSLNMAWYEYSSPDMVSPSDIFYWEEEGDDVTSVTKQKGYDNGPNLVIDNTSKIWISWHSWRKPGKGPFCKDACTNVWMKVCENGVWSDAFMPFDGVQATAYPSMIQDHSGRYVMLFSKLAERKMFISTSNDGRNWEVPALVSVENTVRGDLLEVDNTFYIVCEDSGIGNRITVLESVDLIHWEKISQLENKGTRAKISQLDKKTFALTWQTDKWPAKMIKAEILVRDGCLNIDIESDHSGGNHCWVMNSLEIKSDSLEKKFDFGPRETLSAERIKVKKENSIYSAEKGFGFDGEVEFMQRSFAEGLASDMAYSPEKRRFIVNVPPDVYQVEIMVSSWISSAKKVYLSMNGREIGNPDDLGSDQIFYAFSENLKDWSSPIRFMDDGREYSRPSKILKGKDGRLYMACTVFDEEKVQTILFSDT